MMVDGFVLLLELRRENTLQRRATIRITRRRSIKSLLANNDNKLVGCICNWKMRETLLFFLLPLR